MEYVTMPTVFGPFVIIGVPAEPQAVLTHRVHVPGSARRFRRAHRVRATA